MQATQGNQIVRDREQLAKMQCRPAAGLGDWAGRSELAIKQRQLDEAEAEAQRWLA